MLYTLDYFELTGGKDLNPLIVKIHDGRGSKGFRNQYYRVKIFTYFTSFFAREGKKKKALKTLVKQAVDSYFKEMEPENKDQIPPLVIIVANTPEDSIIMHQELNSLEAELKTTLWSYLSESKVLILDRNQLLSNPRI